tara:strand:- start:268 stop:894 length:627 start_codon:yes stop_codon:yes gene_type:complete
MSIEEKKNQKCNRCKSYRYPSQFINSTGRILKTCGCCRERSKISRDKNKCPHGIKKYDCKKCKGDGICEHNRMRTCCRDCCGGSVCDHDKIRSRCKDCMTTEQKIEFIQKNMIRSSRNSDKKKDRYDANNFIDKPFLEGLFEDSAGCHYCSIDFTYNKRIDTLVSIERLDNNIGHIKSNCVLACCKCNNSHTKKDDIRTNILPEIEYF